MKPANCLSSDKDKTCSIHFTNSMCYPSFTNCIYLLMWQESLVHTQHATVTDLEDVGCEFLKRGMHDASHLILCDVQLLMAILKKTGQPPNCLSYRWVKEMLNFLFISLSCQVFSDQFTHHHLEQIVSNQTALGKTATLGNGTLKYPISCLTCGLLGSSYS